MKQPVMTCRTPALHPRRCPGGFSLIEILAALTVFTILGIIIAQITNAIGNTTHLSNRAVDASSQARLAFDRLGIDLGASIRRDDASFATGNLPAPTQDLLRFLTSTSSPGLAVTNNRNISVVAYRIAPHADNQNRACLLRAGKPVNWSGSDIMGNQANGFPLLPNAWIPATSDYDVLAPGILRMVVGYQLYPDNKSVPLGDGSTETSALGQVVYSPPLRGSASPANSHIDLSRISALVIGLVAIDLDSLRLLDAGQVDTLANTFIDPALKNQLPLTLWAPEVNTLIANPGTLPRPACQAIRLYQRLYPVTPYGSKPST